MNDNAVDIHDDSGRYLQEYISSLENLPSEIQYHWAEIKNRNDQAKLSEKRIKSGQRDLALIHKQWFSPDYKDKKEILLKNQPATIKRIQDDFSRLEDLANERVSLAEEALKLVDRHLSKLQKDLDKHDRDHPELAAATPSLSLPATPSQNYSITHGNLTSTSSSRGSSRRNTVLDSDFDETDEHDNEDNNDLAGESLFIDGNMAAIPGSATFIEKSESELIANRNQKRKKKEAREAEKEEPLYCFCQQVSYGEMVACDGENCPYEWFHMECVGLDAPPKGAWYCQACSTELRNKRKGLASPGTATNITTTVGTAGAGTSIQQPLHKKMKRKKESQS